MKDMEKITLAAALCCIGGLAETGTFSHPLLRRNTTITNTCFTYEPQLSKQLAPGNPQKCEWSYCYKTAGEVTYSINTLCFLEVINNGRGYGDYTFGTRVEYSMTNKIMGSSTKKVTSGTRVYEYGVN